MINFLQNYATAISALANVGLLIVWASYFQILLVSFRHEKRSSILITPGRGSGLSTECMLVNTSQSVVYASQLLVTVKTDMDSITGSIDEIRELTDASDERYLRTQAPMTTGDTLNLGRFQDFVDLLFHKSFGPDWDKERYEDVRAIEITVIANFSTFERPVGAFRRFERVSEHGVERLEPASMHTDQIRTKRECKSLVNTLKHYSRTASDGNRDSSLPKS